MGERAEKRRLITSKYDSVARVGGRALTCRKLGPKDHNRNLCHRGRRRRCITIPHSHVGSEADNRRRLRRGVCALLSRPKSE